MNICADFKSTTRGEASDYRCHWSSQFARMCSSAGRGHATIPLSYNAGTLPLNNHDEMNDI
eukprot:scaffold18237_cov90-Attheya_sp.AAC.1